jgi:hypothetical protein
VVGLVAEAGRAPADVGGRVGAAEGGRDRLRTEPVHESTSVLVLRAVLRRDRDHGRVARGVEHRLGDGGHLAVALELGGERLQRGVGLVGQGDRDDQRTVDAGAEALGEPVVGLALRRVGGEVAVGWPSSRLAAGAASASVTRPAASRAKTGRLVAHGALTRSSA